MTKKENPILDMQPTRESFILYAAWYTCIATFSSKTQALAFKAICEYALFDIPIPKIGFSRTEYAALKTFIPILDSNKKKYENGKKGARHGIKGGRPRKDETPLGIIPKTPNDNENNMDNNEYENDIVKNPSQSYVYNEVYHIFFFKNCDARREIKRFYKFYSTSNWRMSGGTPLDSKQNLIMAAERWKVEDSRPFFPPNFIDVWREVYKLAPNVLKQDSLDVVSTSRQQYGITLVCSNAFCEWLKTPNVYEQVMTLFRKKISNTYRLEIITRKTAT